MSNEDVSKLAARSEVTKEMQLYRWVKHSYENYHTVKTAKNIGYIDKLYATKKGPCFVLGSGPSLDLSFSEMKRLGYPIFAGASQMPGLSANGIDPEYLIVYDSHIHNWRFLRPDKMKYKSLLITHPSCPPRILSQWQGDVCLYRIGVMYHKSLEEMATLTIGQFLEKYVPNPDDPMSFYFRDEHGIFFKSILQRAYPEIRVLILSVSCTPNHACIIADFMGYDPIYLVGVDNGYTYGKERTQIYRWSSVARKFIPKPTGGIPADAVLSDNGVPTNNQMIAYKISGISNYRNIRAQIYEICDPKNPGINNFFPTVSWRGVGRVSLPVWSREEKFRRINEYLETHKGASS